MGAGAPAIELKGITKRFGAVVANNAIDLRVESGSIHGIVGENGAGKSTLMSILYGFYQADSGSILVGGKPARIQGSADAIAKGIGMVHQHFMLVEPFTVLENVLLGNEGGPLLKKGRARVRQELERLERDYALEVDPDAVVGELPVGLQQRVEILRALHRGADILILDEPTGVLTPEEADHLFRILEKLKAEGKTVLLITHKLREIMAATDRVSVMRRGEVVATRETAATSPEELAELMVGRRVLLRTDKGEATPEEEALRLEGISLTDASGVQRLNDITLSVRAGEIVGIAGLAGNGQSELLEVIAGIKAADKGSAQLLGQSLAVTGGADPVALRKRGLAHVPEDRQRMGLITDFEARENSVLGYQWLPQFCKGAFLDRPAILTECERQMADFDVRPPDPRLKTANFSGGNQQKIVLAREIERAPKVLVIGQPTRGVDIGAIEAIHRRLIALRDEGMAILMISVELDEIRALSDRILVMFDGRIMGERGPGADEGDLGLLMAGVDRGEAAS